MDDYQKFDERRLQRLKRWLPEMYVWRTAVVAPIDEWQFTDADGNTSSLKRGDAWPVVDPNRPVEFRATATVPADWAGQKVEAQLWLGGEGFVRFEPGYQSGLNPYHNDFRLTDSATGGERFEIYAQVMPKGLFGSHVHNPAISRAFLAIPHDEVRALYTDLEILLSAAETLKDYQVMPHLLDIVDDAYAAIYHVWPTGTETAKVRGISGDTLGGISANVGNGDGMPAAYVGGRILGGIWHIPPADGEMAPLADEALAACTAARALIRERLDTLKEQYPPVGSVLLTGHAHIDLAWLWPVAETRRKARRTFSSQIKLMEKYDDFIFNQSSAQAYKWVEEDDPALFARIQQAVKDGRWEPIGGSWVEPDSQVSGGEAYVRQLFYGQRYFQEKFGIQNQTAWLPDVFGFSAGVPQILLGAGIHNFFTIKVTWSEVNTFPYDLFMWQGLDGSKVLTHTFACPIGGYNGHIEPKATKGTWDNFRGKRLHDQTLMSFGWGDGGGGPSEDMLEKYARIKSFPALPTLEMGKVEDFFASLPVEGLPTYTGELYLELHRATLTTQARTKRFMRESEHRLIEAEMFASLANLAGKDYDHATIDQSWQGVCYNQFHDVLPGSSIHEVYEDTVPQLMGIVKTASIIRDESITAIIGEGEGAFAIANPSLDARPLTVLLPDGAAVSGGHQQTVENGVLVHNPAEKLGGLEIRVLSDSSDTSASGSTFKDVKVSQDSAGFVLENALVRVEIGEDGTLHSVYDKRVDRETLADRGNVLKAYSDKPRAWDAWDIDETYPTIGEEIGNVESIELTEAGPLRASVKVTRTWRDSRFVQTYRLYAESARVDIETYIDWHERLQLVRTDFPTTIHTHEATFETMYGVHHRPTNTNTSWERARFEVSAHRFADLSEPDYGVALLNNAKYGHNAVQGTLGMSLIRGPLHPDPFADEGEHWFTYAFFPHTGDWIDGNVTAEARALNAPLVAVPVATGAESKPAFVTNEGVRLGLGTLKKAHDRDGYALRVYEEHGVRGATSLTFDRPVASVDRTNLLEVDCDGEEITVDGSTVAFKVRPFEIATLVIRFQ